MTHLPSHTGNYTSAELRALGLTFGSDVSVHRSVQFFNADRITLGSRVRIDCLSVLTAGQPVRIGHNVHLSAGVNIFGAAGVELGDFCGLSSRVSLFSTSDDYADGFLTNPTVPPQFRQVSAAKVVLHPHVIVGCGSVIMPGVTLERGVAVGALSFVNQRVPEFLIVAGQPARRVGLRNRERLDRLEREYLATRSTPA